MAYPLEQQDNIPKNKPEKKKKVPISNLIKKWFNSSYQITLE